MSSILVLSLIAIAVVGIILLTKKIIGGRKIIEVDLAQGVFVKLFIDDPIILDFVNKNYEESIQLGQDRLWEETRKFRQGIDSVIKTNQLSAGNYSIISSALKICKIAYVMQTIEENGPIDLPKGLVTDEQAEVDSGSN